MDIELFTKRVGDKCLHKDYQGFLTDISMINQKLTLLAIWMSEQQKKQSQWLSGIHYQKKTENTTS